MKLKNDNKIKFKNKAGMGFWSSGMSEDSFTLLHCCCNNIIKIRQSYYVQKLILPRLIIFSEWKLMTVQM